jgi:ribose/xylose/arabinose/galactoside ABC-type transport system permease subunit
MWRDGMSQEEAVVSQPPGEPRSGNETAADEASEPGDSPAGSAPGETPPPAAAPGATASPDEQDEPDGPPAAGRGPDEATIMDATAAETMTSGVPSGSAAPAPDRDAGEQQPPPWWAKGQAPSPSGPQPAGPQPAGPQPHSAQPGGPQPPPYQPQPASWGYTPQGQPWPPPAGPGPGRPPAPGDRDRLSVHLIYEAVLAFVAVVLIVATATTGSGHHPLSDAFDQAGYLGLIATGFAFSLRTGSPNLAVVAITSFSSALAAWLITSKDWDKPAAFVVAILLSTLIGVILGLVVAALSVPAWAATLGAVGVIQAIIASFAGSAVIPVPFGGDYPTATWYGLFFVLSVGGGALWLVPAVRRSLSAVREPGDPARWLGLRAGLGPIVGIAGSSFLAGLAAVPAVMRLELVEPREASDVTFVLAAVLLGGVSVFGRRAGVFGTLLAVTILTMIEALLVENDAPFWAVSVVAGLAALLGVAVSRGVESITDMLNRTRPPVAAAPPPAMAPGPYGPPPGNGP